MHQTRRMDGGERGAELGTDEGRFVGAVRTLPLKTLLQRFAGQELGPQTSAPGVDVGAVHENHVRMPHLRQPARFLEDGK